MVVQPLKNSRFRIPKSRYSSVNNYLSTDPRNRAEYSDLNAPFDEAIYERLKENG